MKLEEVNMNNQCDEISNLPQNIIEDILSRMPIRDALRTSVLSKRWQYCWRGMPELVFTENLVKVASNCLCGELKKHKLANAIFHVLLLHNGPVLILEFDLSVGQLHMHSEFAQIISYLASENKVKQLIFVNDKSFCKLPISFFSLQVEHIYLENCTLEPPPIFNNFSRLTSMTFMDVKVSAKMLQRFLSKCPLLERIYLGGYLDNFDFVAGGNKFTFVDLLHCVPLIRSLDVSTYYMKYLCAGGMPHKLPTSPTLLKNLLLDVCLIEPNEISSVLCMIRSSPLLVKIYLMMHNDEGLHFQHNSTNFLDPEDYSDLILHHLEIMEIEFSFNLSRNLSLEMEFVKLIMAKSPVLKKVTLMIQEKEDVSVDEEVKILRNLARASPSAKLIIKRPETCL